MRSTSETKRGTIRHTTPTVGRRLVRVGVAFPVACCAKHQQATGQKEGFARQAVCRKSTASARRRPTSPARGNGRCGRARGVNGGHCSPRASNDSVSSRYRHVGAGNVAGFLAGPYHVDRRKLRRLPCAFHRGFAAKLLYLIHRHRGGNQGCPDGAGHHGIVVEKMARRGPKRGRNIEGGFTTYCHWRRPVDSRIGAMSWLNRAEAG